MKKLLIVALATTAFASSPAFAQATGEVVISGSVTPACGVGNHISGATADPAWNQADITSGDLNLSGTNGQFHGQTFTNRSWGNVWCNGPATVTMSVGALTTSTPVTDTGSFTNRFDVRLTTDAGVYVGHSTGFVLSTVGVAGGVATTGPTAIGGAFETGLGRFSGGTIEVLQPNRSDGEGPLRGVAGSYAGYVRFTATAS